jgi:aminopeptidase-like protein
VALVACLAELLQGARLEYSYRFLFLPGTIGAITWLACNELQAALIRHGLVVACVGDSGKFHYKRSRRGNAEIDRAAAHVVRHCGEECEVRDFVPYGYDERQYCSPGFNLAVGSLTRTPHGEFPEYHTSADNLDLVNSAALAGSLSAYLSVLRILEGNARFLNQYPWCEPQLGRRGLYRSLGGLPDAGQLELAMLWVLNLSDGNHSLLDIAERAQLPFETIYQATRKLVDHELLVECAQPSLPGIEQEIAT